MNSYIELVRLNVCILAMLGLVVGSLIAGMVSPVPFAVLSGLLVVFLICSAGNVINDYYDYEADKISKTHRPLASGRITLRETKLYAALLFLIGNAIAIAFFPRTAAAFAILNSAIAWIYSWKLKRTWAGHLADSWLAVSPFILGGLLLNNISISLLVISAIVFLANFSREIIKGIEDITGDRQVGYKTLEILLGINNSKKLVMFCIALAVITSFIPFVIEEMGLIYLLVVLVADAIFLYSLRLPVKKSQELMKIGMFVGMVAFLIGALI